MGNGEFVFKEFDYIFCGVVSSICNCCFCIKTQRKITLEYEVWDDKKGNRIYVLKYRSESHKT